MRLKGQLPQQPVLRYHDEHHEYHNEHFDYDEHDLDFDKHNLDLDDALVPTGFNLLLRRHSVLQ